MEPQVAAPLEVYDESVDVLAPRRVKRAATPAGGGVSGALDVGPVYGDGQEPSTVVWREALHRRLLAVADVTSAALTLTVTLSVLGQRRVAAAALAGVILLLVLFKVAGLYDRDDLRLVHSTLDEVPVLAQLTGLFALCVGILHSLVFAGSLAGDKIAVVWIASFASIVVARSVARALAGRKSPVERCLVIGEQSRVNRIRDKLASSQARARVIASLRLPNDGDNDGRVRAPNVVNAIVRERNVHRIIIAPNTTDAGDVVDMIRVAKGAGVRVSVLPRIFEVVGSAVEFDDIDGLTMLGVRRFGLSRSSRVFKRTFDLVVGFTGVVVISPLFFAIAVAIRLESRGSIFFRQVRVGRDGKQFRIFKFRSMTADAEAYQDTLRSFNEAGEGLFKIRDDPRITRVGRFLRRTSLDELPQLLNVVRGEMSLVGPRPLVTDEDSLILGLDRSRLHLTPGMTGPWQVLGTRVPMQEMVAIDYLYVANWSLWRDLKILVRTIRHVVRSGNV